MNKNFVLVTVICSLFCFANCTTKNERNDSELITADLEKAIDSEAEGRTLLDFVDTLMYVPLETDQIYLDDIWNLDLYNGNIFVSDMESLYKFNQDGKFICKIGNKGKGPREYEYTPGFFIKSDTIFIRSRYRILAFSANTGNFLSSISFDERYPKTYINKSEKYFITFNAVDNMIEYYNSEGQLLDSVYYRRDKKRILDLAIWYPYYNLFFGTGNSLNFTTYCNDTIFEITDNFNIIPRYVINLGKYKLPDKFRPDNTSMDNFFNNSTEYVRKIITETQNYLVIRIGFWGDMKKNRLPVPSYPDKKSGTVGLGIYDKRENTLSLISKDDEKYPFFYPNFSDGENHLLSFVAPVDALPFYEENKDKYNFSKSFSETMQNIKIDDNPVVIIAKLKK